MRRCFHDHHWWTFLLWLWTGCCFHWLVPEEVSAWRTFSPFRRRIECVSLSSDCTVDEIHEYFMERALALASKAGQNEEVPIGSLVIRENVNSQKTCHSFEILGTGFNQVEQRRDASAHAEILALKQASKRIGNWRLSNCTLYSTLEPCPMCLAASQAFRVDQIVYAARDLRLGAVESHMNLLKYKHPYHTVREVRRSALSSQNQSSQMLRDFFRRKRKDAEKRGNRESGQI